MAHPKSSFVFAIVLFASFLASAVPRAHAGDPNDYLVAYPARTVIGCGGSPYNITMQAWQVGTCSYVIKYYIAGRPGISDWGFSLDPNSQRSISVSGCGSSWSTSGGRGNTCTTNGPYREWQQGGTLIKIDAGGGCDQSAVFYVKADYVSLTTNGVLGLKGSTYCWTCNSAPYSFVAVDKCVVPSSSPKPSVTSSPSISPSPSSHPSASSSPSIAPSSSPSSSPSSHPSASPSPSSSQSPQPSSSASPSSSQSPEPSISPSPSSSQSPQPSSSPSPSTSQSPPPSSSPSTSIQPSSSPSTSPSASPSTLPSSSPSPTLILSKRSEDSASSPAEAASAFNPVWMGIALSLMAIAAIVYVTLRQQRPASEGTLLAEP